MTARMLIVAAILGLAVLLLIAWIVRLQRKSRIIEKQIDYSKIKKWQDDD